MEWRCTWCGKPHAEDDPPCDNCGHNKFERAVEQIDAETTPTDPVWVCTECGRTHQRNSPPCSRCGNHDLEQREQDYDDLEELGGTSYLDVLEPKYAAGYAVVGVLGVVLLLGFAGVITLPTLAGPPALPDAPGESRQVGDLSLSAVESGYVGAVNDRRAGAGEGSLERRDDLDRFATYGNRLAVNADAEGGTAPGREELMETYPIECPGTDLVPTYTHYSVGSATDPAIDDGSASANALARTLIDEAPFGLRGRLEANFMTHVGIDVHVRDGRVSVAVALCSDELPQS